MEMQIIGTFVSHFWNS